MPSARRRARRQRRLAARARHAPRAHPHARAHDLLPVLREAVADLAHLVTCEAVDLHIRERDARFEALGRPALEHEIFVHRAAADVDAAVLADEAAVVDDEVERRRLTQPLARCEDGDAHRRNELRHDVGAVPQATASLLEHATAHRQKRVSAKQTQTWSRPTATHVSTRRRPRAYKVLTAQVPQRRLEATCSSSKACTGRRVDHALGRKTIQTGTRQLGLNRVEPGKPG